MLLDFQALTELEEALTGPARELLLQLDGREAANNPPLAPAAVELLLELGVASRRKDGGVELTSEGRQLAVFTRGGAEGFDGR